MDNISETVTFLIGKIGYDILDNIVAPMAGIGSPFANLYLATINDHTCDEILDIKIINKVIERYKLQKEEYLDEFLVDFPIALLALYIIENGDLSIIK